MAVLLACAPSAAVACALAPSFVATLPTGHYMAGAAAAVALTAALGALWPRLPAPGAVTLWERPVLLPVAFTSAVSFLLLAGLLLLGVFGPRDPYHNLWTLVFWTGVWVALPLACIGFGNLWRPINPWVAPVRALRLALGITGSIGLSRLGHWPAVAGLAGFSWFALISPAPEDSFVLATAAAAYFAAILILAVAEGEDWLQRGEFLTVYLTLLARIAPFWLQIDGRRARLRAGWPGAQVLAMPPLTPSAIAFVTLMLAGLTFDGLSGTFWWLALIGENPLEFSGRSAVMGPNTLGLAAVWALTAGAVLAALRLGGVRPGPAMLSFLAIAAGYHGAHHLLTLLTTGQYTLAALNDPWLQGDAFLGLPPFWVSMGFLADPGAVALVWNVQFAAILTAHVLAVVLALRLAGPGLRAPAHLPLTVLMVGYTVLGLWLLSSPAGA